MLVSGLTVVLVVVLALATKAIATSKSSGASPSVTETLT